MTPGRKVCCEKSGRLRSSPVEQQSHYKEMQNISSVIGGEGGEVIVAKVFAGQREGSRWEKRQAAMTESWQVHPLY